MTDFKQYQLDPQISPPAMEETPSGLVLNAGAIQSADYSPGKKGFKIGDQNVDQDITAIAFTFLGTLEWAAESAYKTITLPARFDFIMFYIYHINAQAVYLQLNKIAAANYQVRVFETATTIATLTGQTEFNLGDSAGGGGAVGAYLVSGRHSDGVKTVGRMGGGMSANATRLLINGTLSGDYNDLTSLSISAGGAITGKAAFYGKNI